MRALLFAALSILTIKAAEDLEIMTRVNLTSIDKTAVCNDGTPATYVYKAAPQKTNKWVIYLKGGGACWDKESCEERATFESKYQSSANLPKAFWTSGILSTNPAESPMYDANKAQLDYCASDYFFGNVGGDNNATTLWGNKFRGQAVLNAFIKHLVEVQGLGSEKNTIAVFGGTSSGGVAAMIHIDHVQEQLKPYGIKLLGYFDCSLYFDTEPIRKSLVGINERMRKAFYAFNVKDYIVPQECAKEYDEQNRWKCIYPEYRLKFVKAPFILVVDQYDNYMIGTGMDVMSTIEDMHFNPEQLDFALKFGERSKKFLFDYDFKANGQQGMIFSTACGHHAVSTGYGFHVYRTINRVSQNEVLKEALEDLSEGRELNKKFIDDCEGVRCNLSC